ncbi:MAG: class I adenylate cyclase [Methylococcaceae bacterium]|nr:class I adenylate cyclase [Methylococcaceae bacterium]
MKKEYPPINLGSPGEDISKKDLQTIKQRFKSLHLIRIQRIQEFLQPRQRQFLDLLPLIFHLNIPLLPGFISLDTPSGIPEYYPSNKTLKAAKKISKNIIYNRPVTRNGAIESLFLMGSVGSIAFSKTSDMDIWLCHESDLSTCKIDELQKKATAIERWAASLDLEVHFFLMDCRQFLLGKDTPMSKDSSGKTQHYLLLEEFYRTAVYIAGKSPAWWLVPPHEENNYTNYIRHLKDNRFVSEQELIDFGGLESVPPEEFISATLWHIYKSLNSPHKSLLKLLLMECYASEYPKPQWLCEEIKLAIYQGTFAITDLDSYLLIYQKVDAYLQSTSSSGRLTLARECFYLKIIGSSANSMDSQSRALREDYLQLIAERWNWPSSTLADLKKQRFWNIKKATEEHGIILHQLSHCFRMILSFANNYVDKRNYQGSNDQKLIGRKLYSFLEKKPGKIEIITTRQEVHAKESELSIVETTFMNGAQGWLLFVKKVKAANQDDFEPLHKSRTLIEILCWIVINGLYQKHLKIHFSSCSLNPGSDELQLILNHLNWFFTTQFDIDNSLETYQAVNLQLKSLIFINVGVKNVDIREDGNCVISERSDALSYGTNRQCFIQTINKVSISSWSEITTSQYDGIDGVFQCLTDIVNYNRRPLCIDDLCVICHTPVRAKSIVGRIDLLFRALVKYFSKAQRNRMPRYLLAGESAYYVFQMNNKILGFQLLPTKEQLLKELASPNEVFSPIYLDQAMLEGTPLPLIFSMNKAKVIQVFYQKINSLVTVYIVDERGSLFTQQHSKSDVCHLLYQYSIFLQSILNRHLFTNLLTTEYYEIQKNSAGILSCIEIAVKPVLPQNPLSLRISGESTSDGITYTIYCNEDEFSSLDHGNQLFIVVFQHILERRQTKQDYPVYISDIDLPLSAFHVDNLEQLQTIHYLNYKQKIEAKLNG